jgi:hypothetical protein
VTAERLAELRDAEQRFAREHLRSLASPARGRRHLVCGRPDALFRDRPRNGSEAHAARDFALERYLHLHALNP